MHFAIIGVGGIGGYYGARLQAGGNRVTFVSRGANLEALQTGGLRVHHGEWRFDERVEACSFEQFLESPLRSETDLVVMCVKAMDTGAVAARLAGTGGGPPAPVLSLQNRVDNEAVLAARLGAARIIGGLAVRIGAHLTAPGVVDATGPGPVVMGRWPNASENPSPPSELLERVSTVFNQASIPARVTENIQLELWRKLVINNGVNPLTAITGLDTATLTSDRGLSQIVYGMMAEAAIAARADGVTLGETDCREMFDLISRFDPIKTSMLVDFEHNRPLELEEICGAVLKRSERLGREAPYTFTVHQLLRRMSLSRASSLNSTGAAELKPAEK